MRSRHDPLEDWLLVRDLTLAREQVGQYQQHILTALGRLTDALDHPPARRGSMAQVGLSRWTVAVGLPSEHLDRVQALHRRVYDIGGAGRSQVEEALLRILAASEDSALVPFWVETRDLSRPRDTLTPTRRGLALAALARLCIQRGTPAAWDALRGSTRHARPEVRALAVRYLGRTYLETERELSPTAVEELVDVATHDAAFEPRFQARSVLRQAELPVPLDNPGGVYALKVKFKWARTIYRTIEVASEQTLEDLHVAIQQAIRWDDDHLYSFFMNGQLHDEHYAFVGPFEEDGPAFTDEAVIGELGLAAKHKFLYYFDYGDSHQFEIEVVGIHPEAEGVTYPRVAESRGEAPPQYPEVEE